MIPLLKTSQICLLLLVVVTLMSRTPSFAQTPAKPQNLQTLRSLNRIPENDPVIQVVLSVKNRTPVQMLEGIITLSKLGRADLATGLMQDLSTFDFTEQTLSDFASQVGSHQLLFLGKIESLKPAGSVFVERCFTAANRVNSDPARIVDLIQQLGSENLEEQKSALSNLSLTGVPAIVPCLKRLYHSENKQQRLGIQAVLVKLDPLSRGPLLAALSAEKIIFKAEVAEVLAELKSSHARGLLAASLFTHQQNKKEQSRLNKVVFKLFGGILEHPRAVQVITRHLKETLAGTPPFRVNAADEMTLWFWDRTANQVVSESYSRKQAGIIWAARLADELAKVLPADPQVTNQAVLLGLQAAKLRVGIMSPLAKKNQVVKRAKNLSNSQLETVFSNALSSRYDGAAVALANILGERQDEKILHSKHGPAPLALALKSPNRQVRYAAITAIMQISPQDSYPGSSYMAEAILSILQGNTQKRVLVSMATFKRKSSLAGYLSRLGYSPLATSSGSGILRSVQGAGKVDFILVDVSISRPTVREVLFQLQRMPATGNVPIGLIAGEDNMPKARRIAEDRALIHPFHLPTDVTSTEKLIQKLFAASKKQDQLSEKQRLEQSRQALGWYAELLEKPSQAVYIRRYSKTIEAVIHTEFLAAAAIKTLAKIGTPGAQQSLVDYASRASVQLSARQHAVEAFSQNVQRVGILLNTKSLKNQYRKYNGSESLPAASQKILSQILDILEKAHKQKEAVIGSDK